PFVWNAIERGSEFTNAIAIRDFPNVNIEVLDDYRNFVFYKSKAFRDMIILGVYGANTSLKGYIIVVNKAINGEPDMNGNGFSPEEVKVLQVASKHIAAILENIEYTDLINKDEVKLKEWYQFAHDNVEDLLNSILKYLNDEFNSKVASYLM